jgi:hypothetical protein
MGLSTAAKNALADDFAALAGYVSAHSADPGDTGASELAGGTYARKAATWTASSGGVVNFTGTLPTLDIPAGSTVAFLGLWSAVTAGTWLGSVDVTDETYGAAGQYSVTSGSYTQT